MENLGARHCPAVVQGVDTLLVGRQGRRVPARRLRRELFIATAGVSIDAWLTYPSFADLQRKQAMIKAATHTYLLADSTKMNRCSFTRLGTLEVVDVTDDAISDADVQGLVAT